MDTTPQYALRPLDESELDALYAGRIEHDFPSAERPSVAAMHRHMQNDLQEIWILTEDGQDVAYAVCAKANGIVLVTLLAVFRDKRGGGRGTALLDALRTHYAQARAILLEVEDPKDATDDADRTIREKRIAFYERFGYRFLTGVEHVSFDVRLLLMALPLQDDFASIRRSTVPDVQAIYHIIIPEDRWNRVQTIESGA